MLRPALILLLLAPALAGCSLNPATGQRAFTGFMGTDDEISVGREQHPHIVRAFGGAYGDQRVQDYVTRVGRAVAQVSDRADLSFTFTVLDTPVVNAFALPGGYVYVTRGLLALVADEAELAGVLAHEIGHIAARHAAQRHSQRVVVGIGTAVVGAVTGSDDLTEMTAAGIAAVLQGHSRDQEYEADTLGIRYLARAGYAADAVATLLARLDRNAQLETELSGRSEVDSRNIMATHPRTPDRVQRAATPVAEGRRGREEYLAVVDGLLYGDNPEHGFVRGRSFIHPRLRLRFEVPPEFRLVGGARQVFAQGPGGAAIAFDTVGGQSLAMTDYLRQVWGRGLALEDLAALVVDGLDAASAAAHVQTRRGPVDLGLAAIRLDPSVHRFLFLAPSPVSAALAAEFRGTLQSFRRLTEAEAASVSPQRLRVHTVRPQDSYAGLVGRMTADAARRFDVINGLQPGVLPPPGTTVKLVSE